MEHNNWTILDNSSNSLQQQYHDNNNNHIYNFILWGSLYYCNCLCFHNEQVWRVIIIIIVIKLFILSLFSGERHMRCQTNNYSAMLWYNCHLHALSSSLTCKIPWRWIDLHNPHCVKRWSRIVWNDDQPAIGGAKVTIDAWSRSLLHNLSYKRADGRLVQSMLVC